MAVIPGCYLLLLNLLLTHTIAAHSHNPPLTVCHVATGRVAPREVGLQDLHHAYASRSALSCRGTHYTILGSQASSCGMTCKLSRSQSDVANRHTVGNYYNPIRQRQWPRGCRNS